MACTGPTHLVVAFRVPLHQHPHTRAQCSRRHGAPTRKRRHNDKGAAQSERWRNAGTLCDGFHEVRGCCAAGRDAPAQDRLMCAVGCGVDEVAARHLGQRSSTPHEANVSNGDRDGVSVILCCDSICCIQHQRDVAHFRAVTGRHGALLRKLTQPTAWSWGRVVAISALLEARAGHSSVN